MSVANVVSGLSPAGFVAESLLEEIDGDQLEGHLQKADDAEFVRRMQAAFPGWQPEHGLTNYGYPLSWDLSTVTDSEVRQWGRYALNANAHALLGCEAGQEDIDWGAHALHWSHAVLASVAQRLGWDDAEMDAYADELTARVDAEMAQIREDLLSLPV